MRGLQGLVSSEFDLRGGLIFTRLCSHWPLPSSALGSWIGHVSQSKDVIISGGFNVYPSDVEDALARHADVAESVVFGIPDAHWGERVEAVVELKEGRISTEQALRNHVRAALGPVRTPKAIHIVGQLPRNAIGKVQKRQLRDEFVEKFRAD